MFCIFIGALGLMSCHVVLSYTYTHAHLLALIVLFGIL